MTKGPRTRALALLVAGIALVGASCQQSPASRPPSRGHVPDPTVVGQPAPAGTDRLAAVSCGSASRCWAVGAAEPAANAQESGAPAAIDATTDGGKHWSAQVVPLTTPSTLSAVSCPDAGHCMAVGESSGTSQVGLVLATADGGRTWRAVDPPAGTADLVGVSCSDPADCQVLATDGSSFWSDVTADGGSTWQRGGTLPAGFAGAGGIECPTTSTCAVAGYVPTGPGHGTGAIATTADGGATWQAAGVPPGTGLLHGIACPGPTTCIAVGTTSTTDSDISPGTGTVLVASGTLATFTAAAAPADLDDGFGISCPATDACAAVGTQWTTDTPPTPEAGVVTTLDGGTIWTTPLTRFVPVGLAGVACPTQASCVAVGGDVIARIALPGSASDRSRPTTGTSNPVVGHR
jgi:photosystem II stability/assembly factor-like uncharacterized protein